VFVSSVVDDASLYDERTLRWMCVVRPEYQPGMIVWKVTCPFAPVSW
jgi:hypothetical protein